MAGDQSTIGTFEFFTAARIVFADGAAERLGELARPLGSRALLVVGGASAEHSGLLGRLREQLPVVAEARCGREPRIEDVDRAVSGARAARCDLVVAVGGGSVLDCGKAASGMITNPGSLLDYLEGVGAGKTIERPPVPMVAVPTTAGTGSEVTKNAVISGAGYKKSVRSPLLIPRLAVVDPRLTHDDPPELTAACGMDALTQLIEAYLSNNASPLTDGLALRGIAAVGQALPAAYEGPDDARARRRMALGSLLGGICLANAGLGAVHGFASPIGALFPQIGHGVACASLLPHVLRKNHQASHRTPVAARVHARLADIGEALSGRRTVERAEAIAAAIAGVEVLRQRLRIPTLSELGITREDLPRIVVGARGSSMRHNPVELTDQQLTEILEAAL